MTLTGRRSLSTSVPSYTDSPTGPSWNGGDGWDQLVSGPANSLGIFYETYFDLSGYELTDLTLVPNEITLQDPGYYSYTSISPDPENGLMVLDIVSQERLDPYEVGLELKTRNRAPGMTGSIYDQTSILYGRYRYMAKDSTYTNIGNINSVVNVGSFGTGQATAVAKLWVYRIVLPLNTAPDPAMILSIPASRFNLFATIIDEDELPYLMRLKRSYEIGTGPS